MYVTVIRLSKSNICLTADVFLNIFMMLDLMIKKDNINSTPNKCGMGSTQGYIKDGHDD